ncbi:MAG: tryptophan 2,3-dioxygenase family protein [Candidatus Kariarchaeaceae archaeon]|jgi:tryptophan 2,3-dioxygenase
MTKDITYWQYLELENLLKLQGGITGNESDVSEDELHFIIVHQVFELWFKLAIRELRLARDILGQPKVEEDIIPFVVHHIKRVNTILQLASHHFELMETLTPQDFLNFRGKLGTASGFQSFQLREMEFILGLDQKQRDAQGHPNPARYITATAGTEGFGAEIRERITNAQQETTLRDALHEWLYRTPIHGSGPLDDGDDEVISSFIQDYLDQMAKVNQHQIDMLVAAGGNEEQIKKQFDVTVTNASDFLNATDVDGDPKLRRTRVAILFIESYRKLPLLAFPRLLLDTIVEMEEYMTEFRFQHARMVERIIGRRVGTGGSAGVDYLDQTTKYRTFPELWAVRTLLLPPSDVPPLKNAEFYSFSTKT